MAKLDLTYYSGTDLYSDGIIEDELLEIVSNNSRDEIDELLKNDNRWPILYHLSNQRGNILSPCDVKNTDVCLEIGSGCGAITETLVKQCKYLDCVDLSKRRCMINQARNKTQENLNIYVANFNDVVLDKKYDKIFLIGVLEYAGLYFPNEKNPHEYMLKKMKSLLKDNGEVFIAIENKYGMKYFSGAGEDHTAGMFNSIEGYKDNGVKTFSCFELRDMIKNSGYENSYFYYPLPDYKFPKVIYSEKYLPKPGELIDLGHSFDRDRYKLFDEDKAMNEAISSKIFEVFSNSYLIKCN